MVDYTYSINIRGTVQGVGFRPFIYTLAQRYGLNGSVSNGGKGVKIFLNTDVFTVNDFVKTMQTELPSLASIKALKIKKVEHRRFKDFQIIKTHNHGDITVNIPADVSICKACEAELFNSRNRRFRYPFISCTHCGVRYSIIDDLPYDRGNTSMKFFQMCRTCEEEYRNPVDRRYHAQPIGCFDCGPTLELDNKHKKLKIEQSKIITVVVALLKQGAIVAMKGVGGYHLLCDATNKESVAKLRARKRRPTKPFAVMVKDIAMAKTLAYMNKKEEEILSSKQRPIVLLKAKLLDGWIAPNISTIGLFLPYTPLHLLILEMLHCPLVATSANISDEPLATDTESIEKLSDVYDYLLDHNRDIVNGCDDSVVMVVKDQEVVLRRARGYAPMSIELPFELDKKVLAVGANQKSTVAIGFDNQAILSPHIGDLKSIESVRYFEENIENLKRIYHFTPERIVYDKHPHYESSKYAKRQNIEVQEVQHHYAHILGVMAEKGLEEKVLGVAFDGTGYGDDGNLWGGEFLVCDYQSYKRVAHIDYFKLLGGAKAIREPKRVALSLLFDLYAEDVLEMNNPTTQAFTSTELTTQYIMWKKAINAPLSSSVGRLFDGVASLTGLCQVMSFEGESGMLMEEFYDASITGHYSFLFKKDKIDIKPMIKEISQEKNRTRAISKFFNTLVEMIEVLEQEYQLPLVLSGGVFQNRVLLDLVLTRVPTAIIANQIPPNDGGIALGQMVAKASKK